MIEVLLTHGALVDAIGTEGSTALHFATLATPPDSQLEIANLLLRFGGQVNLTNRHGKTPYDLATHFGRHDLAQLLLGGGGGGTATDSGLHAAASASTRDVFDVVLAALQSPALRRVLRAFRAAHHHKFHRHAGGDYPLELTTLHAQYAGLLSRHVERSFGMHGLTWAGAAAVCERAAYDGRCSRPRLQLLHQLAAVGDFEAFYDLMVAESVGGSVRDGGSCEDEDEEWAGEGEGVVEEEDRGVTAGEREGEGANDEEEWFGEAVGATHSVWQPSGRLGCNGGASGGGGHADDTHVARAAEACAAVMEAAAGTVASTEGPNSRTLELDLTAYHQRAVAAAPTQPASLVSTLTGRPLPIGRSRRSSDDQIPSVVGTSQALSCHDTLDGSSSTGESACDAGALSDGGSSTFSSMMGTLEMRPTLLEGCVTLGHQTYSGRWMRGRRIGSGSSGEVFLVRDEAQGYEFAAKLVVARDAEAVSRLDDEIALMGSLHHPNIIHYIGTATAREERYICLQYCAGGSVRQMLDADHPHGLPWARLQSYGAQVHCGLHFLHEHLVIHRDLKSDNLLLLAADRETIKIADFGSSHELIAGSTLSHDVNAIRGSPYWMSPEHVEGARCGRKADVWSYGCVVLEMLTGAFPWQYGEDKSSRGHFAVFQLLNRIVRSTGPPPMPPASAMPPGLHELLQATFERDVDRRPTTTQLMQFEWLASGQEEVARGVARELRWAVPGHHRATTGGDAMPMGA